jgi:hypothetical protein
VIEELCCVLRSVAGREGERMTEKVSKKRKGQNERKEKTTKQENEETR